MEALDAALRGNGRRKESIGRLAAVTPRCQLQSLRARGRGLCSRPTLAAHKLKYATFSALRRCATLLTARIKRPTASNEEEKNSLFWPMAQRDTDTHSGQGRGRGGWPRCVRKPSGQEVSPGCRTQSLFPARLHVSNSATAWGPDVHTHEGGQDIPPSHHSSAKLFKSEGGVFSISVCLKSLHQGACK